MALRVGPEGLPWPEGDPGGLRAAAGRASAMEAELHGQASGFPGITGPLEWTGAAHASFSGTATRQSAAITSAAHAFAQAAHALNGLAGIVEDAQHEVLDAARKLHAAREEEKRAVQAAVAARSVADDARRSADAAASSPVLGPIMESQAQEAEGTAGALESRAATAVSQSQDTERWAMGRARAAVDRVKSADARVGGELESLQLVGGAGPDIPAGGTSVSGLGLLVTPLLGSPGALESLGRLVFGSGVADHSSLARWLSAPPPLPPPPPPPRKESHGGSIWAAVGLGIVAAGADVFAGAQLGLDPLADGAAGAADAAAVDAAGSALAEDAAAGEVVAGEAAAAESAAVPVLSAEAADGSAIALSEEEQAAAQAWRDGLPTKLTPANDVRGVYEVNQTGESNFLMKGGDQQIWADGFRTEDANALEAKYIGNPERSPFIEGSRAPDFVRQNAMENVTDELARYGAVIKDPGTPVSSLEMVTNDPAAARVFARLMEDMGIPGRVVVRP